MSARRDDSIAVAFVAMLLGVGVTLGMWFLFGRHVWTLIQDNPDDEIVTRLFHFMLLVWVGTPAGWGGRCVR